MPPTHNQARQALGPLGGGRVPCSAHAEGRPSPCLPRPLKSTLRHTPIRRAEHRAAHGPNHTGTPLASGTRTRRPQPMQGAPRLGRRPRRRAIAAAGWMTSAGMKQTSTQMRPRPEVGGRGHPGAARGRCQAARPSGCMARLQWAARGHHAAITSLVTKDSTGVAGPRRRSKQLKNRAIYSRPSTHQCQSQPSDGNYI